MDTLLIIKQLHNHSNLVDRKCLELCTSNKMIEDRLDQLSSEFNEQIDVFESVVEHYNHQVQNGDISESDYFNGIVITELMVDIFRSYGYIFVTSIDYKIFSRSMFNTILRFAKIKLYCDLNIIPSDIREKLLTDSPSDNSYGQIIRTLLKTRYEDLEHVIVNSDDNLFTLFNPSHFQYIEIMYLVLSAALQLLEEEYNLDISSPEAFNNGISQFVDSPVWLRIIFNMIHTGMEGIEYYNSRVAEAKQPEAIQMPTSTTIH